MNALALRLTTQPDVVILVILTCYNTSSQLNHILFLKLCVGKLITILPVTMNTFLTVG